MKFLRGGADAALVDDCFEKLERGKIHVSYFKMKLITIIHF
jgi:hypothetical protein